MRALKHNLPFNLEVSDIIIPDVCPILGISIKENKGKSGAYKNSISIDKIEPTKGYTKGNIQIMSQLANQMKGAATPEELLTFAHYIIKTYSPARN